MLSKLKLKYIQSLGQKKFRDEEGVFIAEGPKLVIELIGNNRVEIKELFALEEWSRENENRLGKTAVSIVTEIELERISQLTTPNKVVAIVQQFAISEPDNLSNKIAIALDCIQDPGNLGTIIRVADWFGIEQIICSHDSVDLYNPKVVQATMGSLARVNVYYTDLIEWLQNQKKSQIYATALEGQDITTMKKISSGIILVGNESRGLSPVLLELANEKITIPKKGSAESLNAAMAIGIVLSHLI